MDQFNTSQARPINPDSAVVPRDRLVTRDLVCTGALLFALVGLALLIATPAWAQGAEAGEQADPPVDAQTQDAEQNAEQDGDPAEAGEDVPKITGEVYPVSSVVVSFPKPIEGLSPESLLEATAKFSVVNEVYTAPQKGTPTVEITLKQLDDGRIRRLDVTGVRTVVDTLLAYTNNQAGLIGVVVTPNANDIDLTTLEDKRGEGKTQLGMVVYTARVGRVRTLASGDRVDQADREDNPVHDTIREGSPLKVDADQGNGNVLWKTELDDYLFRLNRHPGRRVDAAISAGQTSGNVTLDYLVSESKPWYAFFQLSNTGTDSTDDLRQRLGFVHNQLTGVDDIFSIDFITAGFDESNAVSLSYERPFTDRWSGRAYASYSEYTATDVGIVTQNFNGDNLILGGDLIHNIAQFDELFVDLVGGLRFLSTRTENATLASEGEEAFLLGHIGLEAERQSDLSQSSAYVDVLWSFTSGDQAELVNMGRVNPDESFVILTAGVTHSFYLEPILNYKAWADINDPDTSTLAHELLVGLRGQSALGSRLIPTFQGVAGGVYSVRGYDESAVAGDNSVIATLEYRFHIPRALGLQNPDDTPLLGQPFRFTPETVYGQADWDFVLKAFIDAGYVASNDSAAFEVDETLVGTGLGFEVSYKNNVRFRGDWGIALEDAGPNSAGSHQFHFFLTLLY